MSPSLNASLLSSLQQNAPDFFSSDIEMINSTMLHACNNILRKPATEKSDVSSAHATFVNSIAEVYVQGARKNMPVTEMKTFLDTITQSADAVTIMLRCYENILRDFANISDSYRPGPPALQNMHWSLEAVASNGASTNELPVPYFHNTLLIRQAADEREVGSSATKAVEFHISEHGMQNMLTSVREALKSAQKYSQP